MVKCFLLEEIGELKRFLRRYANGPCSRSPGRYSYHNAMVDFDVVKHQPGAYIELTDKDGAPPNDDPRWPARCACGYSFTDGDPRQVFVENVYARKDTGERMILRDAPPGAMWNAWWMTDSWKGKDGQSLMAKCPDGHDWAIDAVASNCTLPNDPDHRCWIRHGIAPNITVDKNCPGDNADKTCSAGAGSIATPKYHGFLRNGQFTSC